MRVTFEEDLPINFQAINVRGENNRGPGGGFETITQEMLAEGTISSEQLEHLVERAQSICFTHNTLKHGVKLVTVIKLNGEEALRSVSEPPAR